MHLTAAEKVFWVISIIATLGAGLAGLRVRLENENDPCYGGQYGTNYEECIGCIQNESYCASVFGAPGEEEATATPVPDVYCNNYANDYQTCLDCIDQAYCDQIFRGRTPAATPLPKTSTPTAKPKSTTQPTQTPQSSAAGQAPTPTPTPTPTVNCNEYTQNYQTCLTCIRNQAFCDEIFD